MDSAIQVCGIVHESFMFSSNTNISNFTKNLLEMSPELYSIFTDCSWESQSMDCKRNFRPVITEDGLCYTFNLIDMSNIYRDER